MATANKVSVIPCGAMTADLTWLLLKPGRSIVDRSHKNNPAPWVDVPSHCVLVETDKGKILWDTSCPRDWEKRWGPTGLQEFFPYDKVSDDEYLDSRLNQMGVRLDEIDYVILSHLHFDHAGNAQMFKNTNAKLVCHEKEREFAFGFGGLFNGAHLKTDYEGLDFQTVSGDTEFLPGVKLIETPGHTVGTMSMQVTLPDSGTMIFTSDAVYMGESYGPPATPAAIVNNLEQFYASVEKLRASRRTPTRRWCSGTTPSRSTSCAWRRRARTRDAHRRTSSRGGEINDSARRGAHRGDDLHLGCAAPEVRRRRF